MSGLGITPEPSEEHARVIAAAVRAHLEERARVGRPPTWTLAGWTHKRTGVTDLSRWIDHDRRWPMSARLPRGGREFPGLQGRGDAK